MIDMPGMVGFAMVVTPLIITPGASLTLVSARGLAGDHREAWAHCRYRTTLAERYNPHTWARWINAAGGTILIALGVRTIAKVR